MCTSSWDYIKLHVGHTPPASNASTRTSTARNSLAGCAYPKLRTARHRLAALGNNLRLLPLYLFCADPLTSNRCHMIFRSYDCLKLIYGGFGSASASEMRSCRSSASFGERIIRASVVSDFLIRIAIILPPSIKDALTIRTAENTSIASGSDTVSHNAAMAPEPVGVYSIKRKQLAARCS